MSVRDDPFAEALRNAERPMIVVGEAALCRDDGAAILDAAHALSADVGAFSEDWTGFGVLHAAAGRVGALDIGFLPGEGGRDTAAILNAAETGEIKTLFLLGADEAVLDGFQKPADLTVVYIGHHGDAGASIADIILPCAAYTEMAATYVNTEGRVQMTRRAVQPKGEAREGWAIFRALSDVLGKTLPYDSADQLRDQLRESVPSFAGLNYAPGAESSAVLKDAAPAMPHLSGPAFRAATADFYFTNPIARASKTMAECSQLQTRLETPVAAE